MAPSCGAPGGGTLDSGCFSGLFGGLLGGGASEADDISCVLKVEIPKVARTRPKRAKHLRSGNTHLPCLAMAMGQLRRTKHATMH
jgi:hypothetical protein